MEKALQNIQELEAEAVSFVGGLVPQTEATLVTLSGELGAGKTAFTKAVAKTLGVEDVVTSPTFVLEKIYELPKDKAFTHLVHIDAYRLESGAELAPLGFDELMKDSGNLVFLEWPEKVESGLPKPLHALTLKVTGDTARTISYA